jgi:hypothetical protein
MASSSTRAAAIAARVWAWCVTPRGEHRGVADAVLVGGQLAGLVAAGRSEHLAVSSSLVTLRRSSTVHGPLARLADRLRELAFRLPDKGDNAGNAAYVKPRKAVTGGPPRPMLNVQLAVR